MLFSSPQYPLFLAAVFLLYGLARTGRWPAMFARLALMTLIGDLIYLLLCRDTTRLWDPIGGLFYPLVTGNRGGGLDLASLADYLGDVVDVDAHQLARALVPTPFVSLGAVLPAWWHFLIGTPVAGRDRTLGRWRSPTAPRDPETGSLCLVRDADACSASRGCPYP